MDFTYPPTQPIDKKIGTFNMGNFIDSYLRIIVSYKNWDLLVVQEQLLGLPSLILFVLSLRNLSGFCFSLSLCFFSVSLSLSLSLCVSLFVLCSFSEGKPMGKRTFEAMAPKPVFKCWPLDHTKIVRLKQYLLTKVCVCFFFLIKGSNFSNKYGKFISKKYI